MLKYTQLHLWFYLMKKKTAQIISLVVIGAIVLVLLHGLGSTLLSLLVAGVLAYLVFPLIKWLEHHNIHRQLAVGIVFFLLLIGFTALIVAVIPSVIQDLSKFVIALPTKISAAAKIINQQLMSYDIILDYPEFSIIDALEKQLKQISVKNIWSATTAVSSFFNGVVFSIISILNLFLIPIFFFYIISDYETLKTNLTKLIPTAYKKTVLHYIDATDKVLSGYIRGQLVVASILAVYFATALSLLGIEFGFIIGLMTGVLSIIPYVGYTIGICATTIVMLASPTTWMQVILAIIAFVISQIIEGFWLTPNLVGNRVGLTPLTTILALIIGGQLFGILGMLIAIPAACIVRKGLYDLAHHAKIWR